MCRLEYPCAGMLPVLYDHVIGSVMAHLHCRRQTRIWTRIQIPNIMATLNYAEHVHIVAQIQTQIPTAYFCIGQESESDSVPESVSGNVNKP